jgi:stress-induced-phosphoprotein 1
MDRVNEEKEKGNDALKKKNYEKAIHHYTTALDLLGNIENQNEVDYILYSNRSAVRLIVHDYNGALEDALKCTALKPNWAKGYLRVVNAYLCLHDYTKAKEALKKGINASEKDESTTKLLSRARDITEYAQEHKSRMFVNLH